VLRQSIRHVRRKETKERIGIVTGFERGRVVRVRAAVLPHEIGHLDHAEVVGHVEAPLAVVRWLRRRGVLSHALKVRYLWRGGEAVAQSLVRRAFEQMNTQVGGDVLLLPAVQRHAQLEFVRKLPHLSDRHRVQIGDTDH
jgi:hypothetical protein